MRLVSYGTPGAERAGILLEGGILDLARAMQAAGAANPTTDMRLFLEQERWRETAADLVRRPAIELVDSTRVRLGAPVPVPRKLIIAGANTRSHLEEAAPLLGKVAPPKEPMILAKATSSIAGPADEIILPPETRKLDYEVELGVVIGRRARRVKESEVRDLVAGFVTINELSARDVQ